MDLNQSGFYRHLLEYTSSKTLAISYIASRFSLVYPEYLLDRNCPHLPSNQFSMDLDGASRRKVQTFQGERRQKTRKVIDVRLIGSSPFRLAEAEEVELGFKRALFRHTAGKFLVILVYNCKIFLCLTKNGFS